MHRTEAERWLLARSPHGDPEIVTVESVASVSPDGDGYRLSVVHGLETRTLYAYTMSPTDLPTALRLLRDAESWEEKRRG